MTQRASERSARRALQRRVWGDWYYERHVDARRQRRTGVVAIAAGVQMLIVALGLFMFAPAATARPEATPSECTEVVPAQQATTTEPCVTSSTIISATSTVVTIPPTSITATTVPVTTHVAVAPTGEADPPAMPLAFTGSSSRPAAIALAMLGLGSIALGLARRRHEAI